MHDTLKYLRRDPVHRKHHHHELTFRSLYYTTENFALPLSHDEVVYGKRSLLRQMWGDDWQQRAQLRLLFGYQFTQPGKKLLFAGAELGQPDEWDHESRMPIELLDDPEHAGIRRWLADLNALYRAAPALHKTDCGGGFEWINADDAAHSTFSYLRTFEGQRLVVVANFTPQPWHNYRVGVPHAGALARAAQQRRPHLRRQWSRQRRRLHGHPHRAPAVLPLARDDRTSLRDRGVRTRRIRRIERDRGG